MHELSLACSVVELVEKELALHGGGSVRCIEITIGDLSGVDNDAFLFSLNMVLERSAFAGAFTGTYGVHVNNRWRFAVFAVSRFHRFRYMPRARNAEAIKHGWFRDKSFALPH